MSLSPKNVVFLLLIICGISLGFKLYYLDFSILPPEDTYGYVLRGFSIANGDFSEHERKTLGWSIFLAPFLMLNNPETFQDSLNLAKIVSTSISIITTLPMYLLARRFFDSKYSLVAASLFAFEPHISYNAVSGLSEPLYILLFVVSFYLILSKNHASHLLSFVIAGLIWWVRWPGVIIFVILTAVLFLNNDRNVKLLPRFVVCVVIFTIVVSPMLFHRYEQFGDPLSFTLGNNLFSGDYAQLLAANTIDDKISFTQYIEKNGVTEFVYKFLIIGTVNVLDQLLRISFPYLIILLPFGILFSLRALDQNPKFIRANWILILLIVATNVISFAVIPERRFLLHLLPFLVIFSVISVERLIKYGLSTFSFSDNQKNVSLLIIMGIVVILSGLHGLRYELPDETVEHEKIEYAKFLVSNIDGNIVDAGDTLQALKFVQFQEQPELFKNYQTSKEDQLAKNISLHEINLYATSLSDFVSVGKQYDLKYISINDDSVRTIWYPYLDKINDDHPFLVKVFDSQEHGYERFFVKLYKIDNEKFEEIMLKD